MGSPIPHNALGRLIYRVSPTDIGTALNAKIQGLESKIRVRQGRISAIRETNQITDAVLVDLLEQARNSSAQFYTVTNSIRKDPTAPAGESDTITIAAGVVANLLAEKDSMKEEQDAVERLTTIYRNIGRVADPCDLSFDEIKFLGL